LEKERGFGEIISVGTVESTNWWVLGEFWLKLRAVLRERRRKTLEAKGKLVRAKAKLRKTQV